MVIVKHDFLFIQVDFFPVAIIKVESKETDLSLHDELHLNIFSKS